jgi:hypothetical protein
MHFSIRASQATKGAARKTRKPGTKHAAAQAIEGYLKERDDGHSVDLIELSNRIRQALSAAV